MIVNNAFRTRVQSPPSPPNLIKLDSGSWLFFMGVIDLLFPISCLECGKGEGYICNDCLSKIPKAKLFCVECHRSSIDGATHTKCRKVRSIDFAYSSWDYSGVVRKAILKLKYNFAYKIAEELAEKFVEKVKRDVPILPKEAILVPIPLYKLRENWRGFNQAEELGKMTAKKMGWVYEPDLLIRNKKTTPQTELKGKERSSNLLGAFSIKKGYELREYGVCGKGFEANKLKNDPHNSFSTIHNSCVILFDDVLTTGSTLKEACKVLKRKGVKNVWGLTIAA